MKKHLSFKILVVHSSFVFINFHRRYNMKLGIHICVKREKVQIIIYFRNFLKIIPYNYTFADVIHCYRISEIYFDFNLLQLWIGAKHILDSSSPAKDRILYLVLAASSLAVPIFSSPEVEQFFLCLIYEGINRVFLLNLNFIP